MRSDPRTAIAMGRRLRRQSQARLANALTTEMGDEWTRHMVGNLEAGRKMLDVDTLMAIARVQRLPVSFYFEPFDRDTPGSLRFEDELQLFPVGYLNPEPAKVLELAG